MKDDKMQALLKVIRTMDNPPSDNITALSLFLQQTLAPYSDWMAVDAGFGFGEAVLDFPMDGVAIRVVISSGEAGQ